MTIVCAAQDVLLLINRAAKWLVASDVNVSTFLEKP